MKLLNYFFFKKSIFLSSNIRDDNFIKGICKLVNILKFTIKSQEKKKNGVSIKACEFIGHASQ